MKLQIAAPLALLAGLACMPIKTTVTPTSSKTYPPRQSGSDIQVLSQAPANRKIEELALLTTVAIEAIYGKDLNAMLPSLKEAACKMGADAVIIKNVETGSQSTNSRGQVFAVAIKFLD